MSKSFFLFEKYMDEVLRQPPVDFDQDYLPLGAFMTLRRNEMNDKNAMHVRVIEEKINKKLNTLDAVQVQVIDWEKRLEEARRKHNKDATLTQSLIHNTMIDTLMGCVEDMKHILYRPEPIPETFVEPDTDAE